MRWTGVSFSVLLNTESLKEKEKVMGNEQHFPFQNPRSRDTASATNQSGPEVIKLFSCSTEHEILNAHKYKISRNSAFFGLR